MLSSITPLGERAKGNSWTLTTSAYVVGSLLGGALLGLLASPLTALAGLLTPTVSLAVLALIVFSNPLVVVPLWVGMALVISGLFVIGHDAGHQALFASKRIKRGILFRPRRAVL